MRTILITGGAGFIGSELVRQMVAAGDSRVVVLDALTYAGDRSNLVECEGSDRFCFIEGDIADRELVGRLLAERGVQEIVNVAAETHVDRSIDSPLAFVETNVLGACRLLEAALDYWRSLGEAERQAFRFLHVSTDEVYGALGATGAFTEATPYAPRSPYAASKASSDHFVRAYGHTYGLPVLITNSSNSYGPYQFPEKLIPLTIRRAMRGEALPVYGSGSNVRDWLHVTDHCRALRLVLRRGRVGETYNIGGGVEKTNLEVVYEVCRQVEQRLSAPPTRPLVELIEFVEDRPGHDFRYAIDAAKIRNELGWSPEIDFTAGIADTVAWYACNQAWVEATCARTAYQGERLGLSRSVDLEQK